MKNSLYSKLDKIIKTFTYNSKNNKPEFIERKPDSQRFQAHSKIKQQEEVVLNKRLKQLEFINHLELNLNDKQLRFFSLSFLRGLEHNKLSAQRNTISLTSTLRLDAA
ncbi:hypothetical protein [Flavivirga spongiicola]|uniref:Uncharacterized protein n=1 Tax=Flavivirga spongiicola TaxID=421621 RepID=A0ABU7Y058_9FLAO|nr:hypothetical protein [Flavivirga sp. MEBiC05379]MDO5981080.1 hypothetical protein [Flavivirga sp. MEBiC05379]